MTGSVGCEACLRGSAQEAFARIGTIPVEETLVEESHFSVRLLRCAGCGQSYLKTFCESIDRQGGNDPQQWLVCPVTGEEWEALRGSPESALGSLSARACLEAYCPKSGADEIAWRSFVPSLMPHD